MEQTLGKRIVLNRKRMHMTQDQLAEKLGVTAQAVSKWENDQSCPDIATLPKLAQIFGITVDELLGNRQMPTREAEVVEDRDGNGLHVDGGKWEFHWDAGRRGSVGFACWVLLMGALLLIDNLMQTNVGFWSLAWPSFLLMLGLFSSKKFSWTNAGFVLLGGYFLLKNIGLLPFELGGKVIWPALVILFGISLLADALRKPKNASYRFYNKRTGQEHHEAIHRCQVIDNEFECENCFGDGDYLITTELLRCGDVENNFGSAKLDLSGVQAVADDCRIDAECNFGELKLLVPRRFMVQLSPETAFGSVQTQGQPEETVDGTITMHCEANFGSIVICYI